MTSLHQLPFSIGTTSYVVAANLVENARHLARIVNDMELVLFDMSEDVSNLPSQAERLTLAMIGNDHQLTYSVHLPLDLCRMPNDHSLDKAKKVLDATAGLPISAVVAHLDDWYWRRQSLHGFDPFLLSQWQQQALQTLKILQDWVPADIPICIENLESYPPETIPPLAEIAKCALCLDVGHLWKYHHPQPMRFLNQHLPQTKVIHLHAYANGTDHQALDKIPAEQLHALLDMLTKSDFHGILTMEVFGSDDFQTSYTTLLNTLKRIKHS